MAAPAGRLRVLLVQNAAETPPDGLIARDVTVVGVVATPDEAQAMVAGLDPRHRPEVVLVAGAHAEALAVVVALARTLPTTPLVVLGTADDRAAMLTALEAGAAGYLGRDTGPAALRRALRGARAGELPMSRELAAEAVRHFAAGPRRRASAEPIPGLSPRESEVLRLVADGMTDREIAGRLEISTRTVETHVGGILRKLGVRRRALAARRFREGV